jgi:transcriptional regulator with XRE-family HTH domain
MTKAEVGLILAESRRRSGKTQADLATAMGTRQPAIARAEAGLRMPTLSFMERWARATGSPVSLTLGEMPTQTQSVEAGRALVQSALGPGRFNPWDRDPTPVEAQFLEKQGLTREYFELLRGTRGRPARR